MLAGRLEGSQGAAPPWLTSSPGACGHFRTDADPRLRALFVPATARSLARASHCRRAKRRRTLAALRRGSEGLRRRTRAVTSRRRAGGARGVSVLPGRGRRSEAPPAQPETGRSDSRGEFGLCDPRTSDDHRRLGAPAMCRPHASLLAALSSAARVRAETGFPPRGVRPVGRAGPARRISGRDPRSDRVLGANDVIAANGAQVRT